MTLKNKMVFELSDQLYDLIKDGEGWKCFHYGYNDGGREYSEAEINSCFASSGWKRREDLETAEVEHPEMKFPFTIRTAYDNEYVVKQGSKGDKVDMIGGGYHANVYTKKQVADWIASGDYIVITPPPQEAVEVPESDDKSVLSLTIKMDAEQATEAVNELTEALENLEVVLKRVGGMFKEMGYV